MAADVSQILLPFGFTSLESEIYTLLLRESPATGYRVAKSIGKAAANVYKAIESLQQKGAVLVDDGANRSCRAVPSDELLARLTRDFEWRRAEAELALARLNSGSHDTRLYTLRARSQVLERARHMLGNTESVLLMACSGHVAHQLSDALLACGRRNIEALVACPEILDITGVRSARPVGHAVLDEIRLVTDGAELLVGLFQKGREEVVQAVWSRSPYLSVCAHRGLQAELGECGLTASPAESTLGFSQLGG